MDNQMTDPTPNRPADEPGLDDMNHILDGRILATKEELLRWHTAEVRAVLERLPRTGRIESDGIRREYVRIKDIDAELQKLQEEGER